MKEVLRYQNVTKQYLNGEALLNAVDEVSFSIHENEFTAITGPSGSGKSTLLHLGAGLDRPTSGRIFLLGKDIACISDKEISGIRNSKIGFIFQSFNLFPIMTARENVEYPCSINKEQKKNIERSCELLELVGLKNEINKKPHQLSGGQKQRVAIARSLINNPVIVFADEPTANLDHNTGLAIMELLEKINRTLGTVFIFSTHDTGIMQKAKRIIRLADGKVVSDKTEKSE